MRDFLLIMKEHGYFKDDRWNKSESTYSFETGSVIEFFSADQGEEKLLDLKRELAALGVARKGKLKFWLKAALPVSILNLEKLLENGDLASLKPGTRLVVDGVEKNGTRVASHVTINPELSK
jgi:hypothetical protein